MYKFIFDTSKFCLHIFILGKIRKLRLVNKIDIIYSLFIHFIEFYNYITFIGNNIEENKIIIKVCYTIDK